MPRSEVLERRDHGSAAPSVCARRCPGSAAHQPSSATSATSTSRRIGKWLTADTRQGVFTENMVGDGRRFLVADGRCCRQR
eukprot:2968304-Prymnesium_polylepis.1